MFKALIFLFKTLNSFLHQPKKVFVFCLGIVFVSLVLEGTVFQLARLMADEKELDMRIARLEVENKNLEMEIKKIAEPKYLELKVREKLNWVESGDLVFVFSETAKGE